MPTRAAVLAASLLATASVLALSVAAPAAAYKEPNDFTRTGCNYCHGQHDVYRVASGDCRLCHASPDGGAAAPGYLRGEWTGPHGGYTTTTTKCRTCHTVHAAPAASVLLLPADTVTGTCFTCHDGTGGFGVYGTIKARTGIDPENRAAGQGAAHRVRNDATATVPGGDASTGGSKTTTFSGTGGVLACNDCHSPHASKVVQPFLGDRRRIRGAAPAPTTSRLLKRAPTGASVETTVYGSDWCLACHAGRLDGVVHNHPVDTNADGRNYSLVAILATETPTTATVLGPLGGIPFFASLTHTDSWPSQPSNSGNRGFLMPWPRTPQQQGHAPICQQCHEDTRYVGELIGNGNTGDAATATVTAADALYWNGSAWVTATADNPQFQNFPHETIGYRMLVEATTTAYSDDLCLNCHPLAQLP